MCTSISKFVGEFNNCKTFLFFASKYLAGGRPFCNQAHERKFDKRPHWVDPRDSSLGPRKYDAVIENKPKEEKLNALSYVKEENRKPTYHTPLFYHNLAKTVGLNYPVPTISKRLKNFYHFIQYKDQLYKPERREILGPDLAAAHFVVCRGGGVKFVGEQNFVRSKSNRASSVLPDTKDDTYKVEAIDASKMSLLYEGLKNISDLKYLKWLSFSRCEEFNNWYLDFVSSIAPNLEFLDISFCKKVDHNGFGCFYRFRKLKCINVEGISDSDLFKLACLILESENPNLVVIGIALKKQAKSVFTS